MDEKKICITCFAPEERVGKRLDDECMNCHFTGMTGKVTFMPDLARTPEEREMTEAILSGKTGDKMPRWPVQVQTWTTRTGEVMFSVQVVDAPPRLDSFIRTQASSWEGLWFMLQDVNRIYEEHVESGAFPEPEAGWCSECRDYTYAMRKTSGEYHFHCMQCNEPKGLVPERGLKPFTNPENNSKEGEK